MALIHDPFRGEWLSFRVGNRRHGGEIVAASRLEEVGPALERVASALDRGLYAAGFVAYEAAPAFDPTLAAWPGADDGPPLTWWLIGPKPEVIAAPPFPSTAQEIDWRPHVGKAEHALAVEQIRRLIAAGDTYQVNLTFGLEATGTGAMPLDPRALFSHLWHAQKAPHSAFLDTGRFAICSASPELFFRQEGDRLLARPMKGTARRGRYPGEDQKFYRELFSEKNKAENLMITDMTRNDFGKIAEPGSVLVEKLFAAEAYPTVHQLISEVSARTEATPLETLRALFPCASITGAPKKRATEIIRDLERGPRGIYTGAIGWLGPDRQSQFSVAIRTALVDRENNRAHYGVGGGIVWDSRPELEYDECRAKALVLAPAKPPFELLETLSWRPRRGFVRLAGHLDRLEASARFFAFTFGRDEVHRALEKRAEAFEALRHRIRLRLDQEGHVEIEASPWPCAGREKWRLALDDRPVDERETLLFHKTTHRRLYDDAIARHPHADEVILWNRHGRLTEGARSNLVLQFGNAFLTPPLQDGLLPGVYRAELLRRGRLREAELEISALDEADAIFCINSLRGWIRCEKLSANSPLRLKSRLP